MTQHEYVFVALSIILGLGITRLLHSIGILIRVHRRVRFHWSSTVYAICVMAYVLQLWWVGWGLRELEAWSFLDFLVLVIGSIFIYGAAEMALPLPEEGDLDMLGHSRDLGRLSALSMLLYFLIGPYVNLTMYDNPLLPSLIMPVLGMTIVGLMMAVPRWFPGLSIAFAIYTLGILILTA